MKAAIYFGPRDIRVDDVPDATIVQPTDALVRVTHAGVCGSDLWVYRGELELYGPAPGRVGHEFLGVIEAVGEEVRTLRPGQRVIAPYTFSDGTCDFCRAGLHTLCVAGGFFGGAGDGGQGEAVRVPLADGTLVALPDGADLSDDGLAAGLATLTDVMGTGHHGALASGAGPGDTSVVVGDGAVGLCAVLAARRLGADRVIVLGHHADRLAIARRFGATDVVSERGDAAIERVRELTGGGAAHVVECVGTASAFATAIGCARRGRCGRARRLAGRGDRPPRRPRPQRPPRRRPGTRAPLHPRAHGGCPRRTARPLPRDGPRPAARRRSGRLRGHGCAARSQGADPDGRCMSRGAPDTAVRRRRYRNRVMIGRTGRP